MAHDNYSSACGNRPFQTLLVIWQKRVWGDRNLDFDKLMFVVLATCIYYINIVYLQLGTRKLCGVHFMSGLMCV